MSHKLGSSFYASMPGKSARVGYGKRGKKYRAVKHAAQARALQTHWGTKGGHTW